MGNENRRTNKETESIKKETTEKEKIYKETIEWKDQSSEICIRTRLLRTCSPAS